LKPCGLRSGGEPNRQLFSTGSICFPLNFDAFWVCSQSFGTALFFEPLSNCLLSRVRNSSIFPSPNLRTLYGEH
jgi:hypothetical protein